MSDLTEAADIVRSAEAPRFRNPVARDQAWGRFYAAHGAACVVMRHTAVRMTQTNREREAAWRNRYACVPLEMQIA